MRKVYDVAVFVVFCALLAMAVVAGWWGVYQVLKRL